MAKVPGTPGNGQPQQVAVPILDLGSAQLRIQEQTGLMGEKRKVLMIGPVMLMVPFSEKGQKDIVKALTGVQIAKPGEL